MQTLKRPPAPPVYRPKPAATQRKTTVAMPPAPVLIGPPVYRPPTQALQSPQIYRPQALAGVQPKLAPKVAARTGGVGAGIVQRAVTLSYASALGVGGGSSGGAGAGGGDKKPPEKPFEAVVSKGAKKKAKKAAAISALAQEILEDATAKYEAWDGRTDLDVSWADAVSRAVCLDVFNSAGSWEFQVAAWREVPGRSTVNLWVRGLASGALGREALFNYHVYKS